MTTTALVEDVGLSLPRLYALRVGYAVLAIGLAVEKWPLVLRHDASAGLMEGIVDCMLAALSLLAFVGLRYPVKMLPLLLFETLWKLIWLSAVGLPVWLSDRMNDEYGETLFACSLVVIFLVVVPWRYVMREYLLTPAERYR